MWQFFSAELDDIRFSDGNLTIRCDKRAGALTPLLIRPGHHGGFQNARMAVEDALHLQGADILASGDDDVFCSVLDFDVSIGMLDCDVPGVVPSALEALLGGFRIVKVAFHDHVASHHDFAESGAIGRHRDHGLHVHDVQTLEADIADALARV